NYRELTQHLDELCASTPEVKADQQDSPNGSGEPTPATGVETPGIDQEQTVPDSAVVGDNVTAGEQSNASAPDMFEVDSTETSEPVDSDDGELLRQETADDSSDQQDNDSSAVSARAVEPSNITIETPANSATAGNGPEVGKGPDAGKFPVSVSEGSIRVDVGLLNKLMDLVGELVLARNQLLQNESSEHDRRLTNVTQQVNRITTELQERVMQTRMQPVGNIWGKFPRLVRDLSVMCGKEVELLMDGAETEVDKSLLEAIKDPLTHLIRNAIDHGIETAEQRLSCGKNKKGQLHLRA
ncbi:MAG: hypothetical protein ACPHJ3_17975, partial [Rubripirellula sp.]